VILEELLLGSWTSPKCHSMTAAHIKVHSIPGRNQLDAKVSKRDVMRRLISAKCSSTTAVHIKVHGIPGRKRLNAKAFRRRGRNSSIRAHDSATQHQSLARIHICRYKYALSLFSSEQHWHLHVCLILPLPLAADSTELLGDCHYHW